MSKQSYSTKKSTQKSTKQAKTPLSGQANIFGGMHGVEQLIDPVPNIIEQSGIRVVGVVIPDDKAQLPGYIPLALKQARSLVPEVQTSGKPPWLSASWQANRRKQRAGY